MDSAELRRIRLENAAREQLHKLGWYHSFQFDDGTKIPGVLSVEVSEHRFSQYPLPMNLTGKRVLDIGAWDGWFSFKCESRGAAVTAIDMVEVANFRAVHAKLHSKVEYRELDLFEIPGAALGKFDYVLFLGVLYHTKYPLLALELVCGICTDLAVVESYVTDSETWAEHRNDIPTMEFYEAEELGGQLDNWHGPTVSCLRAMCRAAGFARVELLYARDNRAAFACYRHWVPENGREAAFPGDLRSVKNTIRGGINFRASREEYLTWWFEYSGGDLHRDDIRLKVGAFGLPVIYTTRTEGDLWLANSRLPVQMEPGIYDVSMSIKESAWSAPLQIAVDSKPQTERLDIDIVCDGRNWRRGEVDLSAIPPHISLWVSGLGPDSDEVNTRVVVDGTSLKITYIGKGDRHGQKQVNAELSAGLAEGEYQVYVTYAGVSSESRELRGSLSWQPAL